jgi:hypothetical protein
MRTRRFRWTHVLLLLIVWLPATRAQESPRPVQGELRDAMMKYFEQRLRADLAVTDEQIEQILPLAERLERARTELRRDRMETTRRLRRGLRDGSNDRELQAMLDRLTEIQEREQRMTSSAQMEIDGLLTVQQRVRYRFFTMEFRREIQRRIEQLRENRNGSGPGRRPGPRRRP